jgi:hypothetical protein
MFVLSYIVNGLWPATISLHDVQTNGNGGDNNMDEREKKDGNNLGDGAAHPYYQQETVYAPVHGAAHAQLQSVANGHNGNGNGYHPHMHVHRNGNGEGETVYQPPPHGYGGRDDDQV